MKDRGQVAFEAYCETGGVCAHWAFQGLAERRRWAAVELACMGRAPALGEANQPAAAETGPSTCHGHCDECLKECCAPDDVGAPTPQGARVDPIESGKPGKVVISNASQGAPRKPCERRPDCMGFPSQDIGETCVACGGVIEGKVPFVSNPLPR